MTTKADRKYGRMRFGPDDRVDIVLDRMKGRLIGFTLNYRAKIHNEWKEVIRYDTHHGRLHVHRFWRRPDRQVEFLEEEKSEDYRLQYAKAKAKIEKDWRRFRYLIGGRA